MEYARLTSSRDQAGGHVFALPLGQTVPRGTWRVDIKADVNAPALASARVLVEDFLPERIDVTLDLPEGPLRGRGHAAPVAGAPAGQPPRLSLWPL